MHSEYFNYRKKHEWKEMNERNTQKADIPLCGRTADDLKKKNSLHFSVLLKSSIKCIHCFYNRKK